MEQERPIGHDESAMLAGLLTAVCRPSLDLAPAFVMEAPSISGAGTGKGMLARCMSLIAFGREPHAVTGGGDSKETDKRIAAELMEGHPMLFLDNLNNAAFRSDLLASVITERPSRVRVLGLSKMVLLNASAFVVLTGNGLSVAEDLARRVITVRLDAKTEDPEARPFKADLRAEVLAKRPELLAALLTIWRWGRRTTLPSGKPLGSFERWSRWVRDPLLALGCKDVVEQVSRAKARDAERQFVGELFETWRDRHGDSPVAIRNLHEDVSKILDPQGRGRQFIAAKVRKLIDTRAAGFILTRQAGSGKWSTTTYALMSAGDPDGHRDHRGHRPEGSTPRRQSTMARPLCPYAPYALVGRREADAENPAEGEASTALLLEAERRYEPPGALEAARAAGIEVQLDGKDLVLSAASEPPADVLDMLRRHKAAIVELLRQRNIVGTSVPASAGAVAALGAGTGHRLHPRQRLRRHHRLQKKKLRQHQCLTFEHQRPSPSTAPRGRVVDRGLADLLRRAAAIAEFDGGLSRPEAEKRASITASASGCTNTRCPRLPTTDASSVATPIDQTTACCPSGSAAGRSGCIVGARRHGALAG